jgi:hypothetical protein
MRRLLVAAVLAALLLTPIANAWTWPAAGPVLQPFRFDPQHPFAAGQHRGIDIGGAPDAQVPAPAAGVVSFAGSVPSSGKSVTITTADGYAITLTHLGSIAVTKGAAVAEGDGVGTIGPSGDAEVPQPFVHLGVRVAAQPQGYLDPIGFLPVRVDALDELSPPAAPAAAAPDGSQAPLVTPAPDADPATTETPDPVAVPGQVEAATDPVAAAVPAVPQPTPVHPAPAESQPPAPVAVPAAPEPEPVPATVGVAPSPAVAPDEQDAEAPPVTAPAEERPDVQPAADLASDPASDPAPGEPLPAAATAVTLAPAVTVQPAAAPGAAAEAPPAADAAARPAAAMRTRDELPRAHPMVVRASGASPTHAGLLASDMHADAEAARRTAAQRAGESRRPPAASPSRPARSSSLVPAGARHARAIAATTAVSARRARGAHDGSSSRAPLVFVATSAALALAVVLGAARIMVRDVERTTAETEDPGCAGVALCGGAPPPGPRGGLRRPVRRVRPLSPAEGQRRPHGERHGRARHAGDGGRRPGTEVLR